MFATPESPRMFESDLFDFFSRVPWFAVPILFVPLTGALVAGSVLAGAPLWAIPLQVAAGFFVWTLTEYWLHRTLFHWIPDAPWGERFHFFLHGVHHQWVNDRLRLVMPPAASLALAVVFGGLYFGIAQLASPVVDPSWFYAFFAGKVLGYMNYDLTHYYIHHGRPSLKMYKRLRRHHQAHHHNPRYKELKFGVSTTLWDHVFRTYA